MPCARAPALGGGDDDAAVARAEVNDVILRRDLRQIQHFVRQCLRCRNPYHILARLAHNRFKLFVLRRRLGKDAYRGHYYQKPCQ